LRVILDGRLRTPPRAQVVGRDAPTMIVTAVGAAPARARALEAAGAAVLRLPARGGRVPLARVLAALAELDIQSLLVEGGSQVLGAFIDERLVDRVALFVALACWAGACRWQPGAASPWGARCVSGRWSPPRRWRPLADRQRRGVRRRGVKCPCYTRRAARLHVHGIIEATGTVEALAPASDGSGARLAVRTDLDVAALPLGASIAVDGVCLTVVERGAGRFAADLGRDDGAHHAGPAVPGRSHPPRAAAAPGRRAGRPPGVRARRRRGDGGGAPFGGDGAGAGHRRAARRGAHAGAKGSIAVDGVSLTVNTVGDDRFSVTLIPHTLAATKLGQLAVAPVSTWRLT